MYEAFYGFSEKPFSLLPDPDFLFLSRRHRKALNMLEFAVLGQASFTLITGEVGTGKTLMIKHFLRRVGENANVGLIESTHHGFGSLLDWMLSAFGIEEHSRKPADRYRKFIEFLEAEHGTGRRSFLIIDEAQNLGMKALEELRILSNVNRDKKPILQVILAGQPELLEKLNRPQLRQFAQRISVSYQLSAFTPQETCDYIRYRLTRAGGSADIFDIQAITAAYWFSQGVPRLINLICDSALVLGFGEDLKHITLNSMLEALETLQTGGLNNLSGVVDAADRYRLSADIVDMAEKIRMGAAP